MTRLIAFCLFFLVLVHVSGCCCMPFPTGDDGNADSDSNNRGSGLDPGSDVSGPTSNGGNEPNQNGPISSQGFSGTSSAPDSQIREYWPEMPESERRAYVEAVRELDQAKREFVQDLVIYQNEFNDFGGIFTLFVMNTSGRTLENVIGTLDVSYTDGTSADFRSIAADSSLEPSGRTKLVFFIGSGTPSAYGLQAQEAGLFPRQLKVTPESKADEILARVTRLEARVERARSGLSIVYPEPDRRITETDAEYGHRIAETDPALQAELLRPSETLVQMEADRQAREARRLELESKRMELARVNRLINSSIVVVDVTSVANSTEVSLSYRGSDLLKNVELKASSGEENDRALIGELAPRRVETVVFDLKSAESMEITASVNGEQVSVLTRDEYDSLKEQAARLETEVSDVSVD